MGEKSCESCVFSTKQGVLVRPCANCGPSFSEYVSRKEFPGMAAFASKIQNVFEEERHFGHPSEIKTPVWLGEEGKYKPLREVLNRAYDHAAAGKGAERHATGQDFAAQPMQTISDLVGDNHGCLFQAIKKCQESTRLPKERAVNELLGAINYLAGAIIFLEKSE